MNDACITHNIIEKVNQCIMLNEYIIVVEGPDDYKLISRICEKYKRLDCSILVYIPEYFTNQNGCVGVRKVFEEYKVYSNRIIGDQKVRFIIDRDYIDFVEREVAEEFPLLYLEKNSIESYSICEEFLKYVYESKTRCGANQIDSVVYSQLFQEIVDGFDEIFPVVIDSIRGEIDSSYVPVIRFGDSEHQAKDANTITNCNLRKMQNIEALRVIAPHFNIENFDHIRHSKGKWLILHFADRIIKTNASLIQKCKSKRYIKTCSCNGCLCFLKMDKMALNDIISKSYEYESKELWRELRIA